MSAVKKSSFVLQHGNNIWQISKEISSFYQDCKRQAAQNSI